MMSQIEPPTEQKCKGAEMGVILCKSGSKGFSVRVDLLISLTSALSESKLDLCYNLLPNIFNIGVVFFTDHIHIEIQTILHLKV